MARYDRRSVFINIKIQSGLKNHRYDRRNMPAFFGRKPDTLYPKKIKSKISISKQGYGRI